MCLFIELDLKCCNHLIMLFILKNQVLKGSFPTLLLGKVHLNYELLACLVWTFSAV